MEMGEEVMSLYVEIVTNDWCFLMMKLGLCLVLSRWKLQIDWELKEHDQMASRELNLQGMLLRRRYLDFGPAKQQIEKEAAKRVPEPAWPVDCRSDVKMIGVSEGVPI